MIFVYDSLVSMSSIDTNMACICIFSIESLKFQINNFNHKMEFSLDNLRQLDILPQNVYENKMQGLFQTIKKASKQQALYIQNSINLYSMYGSHRNSNIRLREALVNRCLALKQIQIDEQQRKNSWWPFNKFTIEKSSDRSIKRYQQQKGFDKANQYENDKMNNKQKNVQKVKGEGQMKKYNMLGKDFFKDLDEEGKEEITKDTFQEEQVPLLASEKAKLKKQ